jgi:hypothetical protein
MEDIQIVDPKSIIMVREKTKLKVFIYLRRGHYL